MLNLNTQELFNNYTANPKEFKLQAYYPKGSFIAHALADFAKVLLVRNDDGLISMQSTMKAANDDQLNYLVMFVASVNRSIIAPIAATKLPAYGAFTPLFMYAHKLYNDVEYTEWDKDDAAIEFALGTTLYNCYEYSKLNPKPELDNIKELRKELMVYKSGKKEGQQEAATSYKMGAYTYTSPLGNYIIPPNVMRMQLQTWIANAELRDEKAMILDVWDWGNIPAPLDIKI